MAFMSVPALLFWSSISRSRGVVLSWASMAWSRLRSVQLEIVQTFANSLSKIGQQRINLRG